MRVFDRFWSCLPYLHPMATAIGASINDGIDADRAGCHDLLGTRCDPYVHQFLAGDAWGVRCHANLVRAVALKIPPGSNNGERSRSASSPAGTITDSASAGHSIQTARGEALHPRLSL
jgi:hypothetical protein